VEVEAEEEAEEVEPKS